MLTQRFPSALMPQKRKDPLIMPNFAIPPCKYRIHPIAFIGALIGGPLLVTVLTFWAFFIPIGALYIGALPYLVLGTPVLLYYLPRHGHAVHSIAGLALGVDVAALSALMIAAAIFQDPGASDALVILGGFSLLFAPMWGASFAWLYGKFIPNAD